MQLSGLSKKRWVNAMGNESSVIIRQARMDEIDRVMAFLKENWDEKHIMANNRELMCYEHAWNGTFTFILAEDAHTKKLYGVCGYMPYSEEKPTDIGAGIWKVIQSPRFMLGTELLKYVQERPGCRMLACCGANPHTKGHRKLIGHSNFKLNHYYRLNPSRSKFEVAIIQDKKIIEKQNDVCYDFVSLDTIDKFKARFDMCRFKDIMPYRDYSYIKHKYFDHIKYQYRIIGIEVKCRVDAVIVGRDVCINNRKIFRIIDFMGKEDAFAGTYNAWEQFISEGNYEYVDFYEYGLLQETLLNAGFVKRLENDVNVIPNYFEPFVQKNIEIHISTNIKGSFRMFKGDGDQDRPNIM